MSIKKIAPMAFQLNVLDPYIIAMHHRDLFPRGNGKMGSAVMPPGKNNGSDFNMDADWRMYHGDTISGFAERTYAELSGNETIRVKNGGKQTKLLLLEGEPINEPVAARGPFVMNDMDELRQAFFDYNRTRFGGWQWDREDPVNAIDAERFASYRNGERLEFPPKV